LPECQKGEHIKTSRERIAGDLPGGDSAQPCCQNYRKAEKKKPVRPDGISGMSQKTNELYPLVLIEKESRLSRITSVFHESRLGQPTGKKCKNLQGDVLSRNTGYA
jgi:hypothetical protein